MVNGWNLYYFHLFKTRMDTLQQKVERIAQNDPERLEHHKTAKLLKAVIENVYKQIPAAPEHKQYRLGKTSGKEYTAWRRVKNRGLPPRYRLFFKFSSTNKAIIYARLNDVHSLRKEGAKTDVYEVFKKMLQRGEVPAPINELIKQSSVA